MIDKYKPKDCLSEISSIPCELKWKGQNVPETPFISVVIPTYKRADIIRQSIDSAAKQIGVNFDYEIIVVDNDNTVGVLEVEELIMELNIENLKYYKNTQNLGGAGNWNRCVMLARSEWVVMCHDDDMMKPNCLLVMSQIIKSHEHDNKGIGYIRSNSESFYDSNVKPTVHQKNRIRLSKKPCAITKFKNFDVIITGGTTWAGAPTCGTLINKTAFIDVGGYNKELTPCFDCYLVYFMMRKGYFVGKTYYTLGYYRWGDNDTYKKSTLLGLIVAFNEFLRELEKESILVRFFTNEHYADCVHYYRLKGIEGHVALTDDDINSIRSLEYSKIRLNLLYFIRKMYRFSKELTAK